MSDSNVIPIHTFEIDGELLTADEWRKREQEKRDAFYRAHHAEIVAAQPSWALKAVVDAVADDEADLVYLTSYGSLELSRAAEFVGGRIVYSEGTDRPIVAIVGNVLNLSVEEMRELAASLLAAVPAVEAAGVTL